VSDCNWGFDGVRVREKCMIDVWMLMCKFRGGGREAGERVVGGSEEVNRRRKGGETEEYLDFLQDGKTRQKRHLFQTWQLVVLKE
jgi:hypothetical protein